MIPGYLKKRNFAVIIYLTGMCAAVYRNKVLGITYDDAYSYMLIFLINVSLIAACWFYLKAKKRTSGWLILMPLNVVAFIIYFLLEDRTNHPDNIPCPACGAANFPVDSHCRLCKTELKQEQTLTS